MEFILNKQKTMSIEKIKGNKYAMFKYDDRVIYGKERKLKVCVHTFADGIISSFEKAKSYIASEFGYDSAVYFAKYKKFEWVAK